MCRFGQLPKGFGYTIYVARKAAAAIAIAGVMVPAHAQSLNADDATRRDAAILAARDGKHEEAIAAIEELRARYRNNLSLVHDEITVLAWAENDSAVLLIAESLAPEDAPRYAQLAVGKSARNEQRFDVAAAWYDAAIAQDPDDIDALSGRVMAAGDAGDIATVRALIARSAERARANTTLALASAYALRMAGASLEALLAYDAILENEPAQREALRGKALVLRSLLLPTQALALNAAHPGILTETEVERLLADETAVTLRITTRTPYPEESTPEETRRPVELIDDQLQVVTTVAARDALLLDRVVALADANEGDAAIEAFESLPATANREQAYVLTAAARAYMQTRRPKEALRLLERARDIDPNNLEVRFQLVFAWLDLNRFDDAITLADELTAELPMTNRAPDSTVIKGNENRIRAEHLAGIAEAYGDQLDAAQARFEALLETAPNNHEWRHELANIYRWRGWLDRSLEQYRQVLTTDSELLSARLGQAHAQIDARDYRPVEVTLAEVSSTYGRDPAVQQLERRWEIHNDSELSVTMSTGESSGPVSGTESYTIDARWYTGPLGYRFRLFAATHDGYADFPEGESLRRRFGTGLEYRAPHVTLTLMASGSRDEGESGIAALVDFRLGDLWSIGTGVESNSDSVALRAHRTGIEADRAYFNARVAPSELASFGIGVNHAEYSDENRLQIFYLDGRYRLANKPRSKLDLTGGLAYGRAETSNVPYYSPTSDETGSLGLEHRYRLFRRYDRELRQTFGVSAGRYLQAGFDAGSTWSASYRLDWTLGPRFALGIQAERLGQFYDGLREYSTVGSVSIAGRF